MRRWMSWHQADEKEKKTVGRMLTGMWTVLCCDKYEHRSASVSNVAVLCSSKS